jgi:hypothetical protein
VTAEQPWVTRALNAAREQTGSVAIEDPDTLDFIAAVFAASSPRKASPQRNDLVND